MKKIKVLPADTYTVVNKTIITDKDRRIISMLYQPIIGYTAVSLYYTLTDDLDKQEIISTDNTHFHLMTIMQLKLEEIIIAREKLEAIGLLKTYVKQDNINQYVYLLYSPITPNEFFNHPILNIVLYNNLGKKEYDKVLNYFKVPRLNLKDYEEVSKTFDEVFKSHPGNVLEEVEELKKKDSNNLYVSKGVDFDLIINSIPASQISSNCFNEDTKRLINNLSFAYNLDSMDMKDLVRNCINGKGLIDKVELRKSCRNYYKFENSGNLPTLIYNKQPDFLKKPEGDNSRWAKMVYTFENITPYQLLKAKYKGGEPTARDKKLVEDLMEDQKLNPGVVNVLLSYILQVKDQKLTRSYVETIAGEWKRSNIETVEDAMRYAEKNHKKLKKIMKPKETTKQVKTKQEKELPVWFNKENEVEETTTEDIEELENILNELV